MRVLKLKKNDLFSFLETISKEAELWAPVQKGDKHVFEHVQDFSLIQMKTTRTIIPPKKLMVPFIFNTFTYTEKGYQEDLSHITQKILFGIHPCDIHGLLILDKLFIQEYIDPYYQRARNQTLILGLSCLPDEHCFCRSTHTHIIEEGYDLFFTDLESYFLVWIGSSQGDDLIRLMPNIFDENLSNKDIQTYILWRQERDKAFKTEINFITMPDLMELEYKAPFWEKVGQACLACGSCTMVCPTCNCYNIVDKQYLGGKPGKRIRHWDSCTLHDYSLVAGGENFREKKSDRLKLWYTHKLQAYVSKYGKPSCVGCGRCLVTCPVGINVKTVARALEGKEVDAFWNRLSKEVTK
jgi:sulfhydrogenase subunit beta (sulfur reductase)